MHREAGLRRGQPVVAELGGQDRDQPLVGSELLEHVAGGALRPSSEVPAHHRPGLRLDRAGQCLGDLERQGGGRGLLHGLEVPIDRGLLGGEPRHEHVPQVRPPLGQVVGLAADDDPVIDLAHVGPLDPAVADVVEHRAHGGAGCHVADVVHPDVPVVARAVERVRVAARGVVPLEDEHLLPAVLGQHGGAGKPADSRSDDDGVVVPGHRMTRVGLGHLPAHRMPPSSTSGALRRSSPTLPDRPQRSAGPAGTGCGRGVQGELVTGGHRWCAWARYRRIRGSAPSLDSPWSLAQPRVGVNSTLGDPS